MAQTGVRPGLTHAKNSPVQTAKSHNPVSPLDSHDTEQLRATLRGLRSEVAYTSRLADLTEMMADVRTLTSELADAQQRFLAAEQVIAQTSIPLPRHPVRPLPSRPRTPPPAPPDSTRTRVAAELVELTAALPRVPDAVQQHDLANRLALVREQLDRDEGDIAPIRGDVLLIRALMFAALKAQPVKPATAAPTTEIAAAVLPAPRRAFEPAPFSSRWSPTVLRNGAIALAAMVVLACLTLAVSFRRSPQAPPPPAPSPAAAQQVPAPPVARTSLTRPSREYTDPAGRFRCVPPLDWQVIEENTAHQGRVRFRLGANEILVISQGTDLPPLDPHDTEQIQRQLIRQIEISEDRDLYCELLGARWDDTGEVVALQVGLRMVLPTESWRVLAVQFRQHGRDHIVALFMRADDPRIDLPAVFQKFVYAYTSLPTDESGPTPATAPTEQPRMIFEADAGALTDPFRLGLSQR